MNINNNIDIFIHNCELLKFEFEEIYKQYIFGIENLLLLYGLTHSVYRSSRYRNLVSYDTKIVGKDTYTPFVIEFDMYEHFFKIRPYWNATIFQGLKDKFKNKKVTQCRWAFINQQEEELFYVLKYESRYYLKISYKQEAIDVSKKMILEWLKNAL